MKQRLFTLCLALVAVTLSTMAQTNVTINNTNFPDQEFRNFLLSQDYGADGVISSDELMTITSLNVNGENIEDLSGVKFFTRLQELDCSLNPLTSLDVSQNTNLKNLKCSHTSIASLDVSQNKNLRILTCGDTEITSLDVSTNTNLEELYCNCEYRFGRLKSLTLSANLLKLKIISICGQDIAGKDMDHLVYYLPKANNGGTIYVISSYSQEDNVITAAQVQTAKNKGWEVKAQFDNSYVDWPGEHGLQIIRRHFPSYEFRQFLHSRPFGEDSYITNEELAEVTEINLNDTFNWTVKDATGIGHFPALKYLTCSDNKLTSLDVSKNTNLEKLYCGDNSLEALDVSKNTKLTYLSCRNNSLTSLDVSQNKALEELYCFGNNLTSLTISSTKNTALKMVACSKNNISGEAMTNLVNSLPVRPNNDGKFRVCRSDIGGTDNVITSAQVQTAVARGWSVLSYNGTTWENYNSVAINDTNFPNKEFRIFVRDSYDKNLSGSLSGPELTAVTTMDVSNMGISKLNGIEFFLALKKLYCRGNSLTSLDVSMNKELTYLTCRDNQLTSLDVSKNTKLTELYCYNNKLTKLNVSGATALKKVECYDNELSSLDVSGATALEKLYCYRNGLTSLNVSGATTLKVLSCYGNSLSSLDVSKNTALEELYCYNNNLTSLDVSKNTGLKKLTCHRNNISGTAMTNLVNSLPVRPDNDGVFRVCRTDNGDTDNVITSAQVQKAVAKGWRVMKYNGTSWVDINDVEINETNFPDEKFRKWIKLHSWADDDLLTADELAQVTSMDLHNKSIETLKGIEYFTALEELNCNSNNLTSLDVSQNTKLTSLQCISNTKLTSLNVSANTALTELSCSSCKLSSLDVSANTALTKLLCKDNNLESLDVSANKVLTNLSCGNNSLTSLDVSANAALTELYCHNNKLESLDVSALTELTQLRCYSNWLTSLDVTMNKKLVSLQCYANGLTSLKVSPENTALKTLYIYQNNIIVTAMDDLVNNLPTMPDNDGKFEVCSNSGEGNSISTDQVAVAKAKGWPAKKNNGEEYEGDNGKRLVEVSAGYYPKTWTLDGRYYDNNYIRDERREVKAYVSVSGDRIVYVQGLASNFPDAWIIGSLLGETVVFPSGQYVGTDDEGDEFLVGYDGDKITRDFRFAYDAEAKTLTQQTAYICENSNDGAELAYRGYWTHATLSAGELAPMTPVEAPDGLATESYKFNALQLSQDDELARKPYTVKVLAGFDEGFAYFKGFSDNTANLWAKGTLNWTDGTHATVTIPANQFMGTRYDQPYYMTALDDEGNEVDLVLNYDATTHTFTTGQTMVLDRSRIATQPYLMFKEVEMKMITDAAATPADPSIVFYFAYGSNPYLAFGVPTVDVEGNDMQTSKLYYRIYYKKDGVESVFTVTPGEYPNLEKSMNLIPYEYDDNSKILRGGNTFYINPTDEIRSWQAVGIQSVYQGGGEQRSSNIVWRSFAGDADGDSFLTTQDVDYVVRYITTGVEPYHFMRGAADANQDNKVNVADVVVIQNMRNKAVQQSE